MAQAKIVPIDRILPGTNITVATGNGAITISSSGGGGGGPAMGVASLAIGVLSTVTTVYVQTGKTRGINLRFVSLIHNRGLAAGGSYKAQGAEYMQAYLAFRDDDGTVNRYPAGSSHTLNFIGFVTANSSSPGSRYTQGFAATMVDDEIGTRMAAGSTAGFVRIQVKLFNSLEGTASYQGKIFYSMDNSQM